MKIKEFLTKTTDITNGERLAVVVSTMVLYGCAMVACDKWAKAEQKRNKLSWDNEVKDAHIDVLSRRVNSLEDELESLNEEE